jgi:hypothetical protein
MREAEPGRAYHPVVRRTARVLLAVATAAVAVVCAPGAVLAAPPWSEPEAVPGSMDFGYPASVAVAEDGTVAVAFIRDGVQLALRRPGGRWAEPRTLSRGTFAVTSPGVVITRRGELVVTWTQAASESGPVDGPITIRAVVGRVGGRLGRPRRLGTSSHFRLAAPEPVAGARGHVAVVWRGDDGDGGEAVRVATRAPRRGFRRAEAVPDAARSHEVYHQQAAVGPSGGVHVAWTSSIGPAVRYAHRPANGDWGRSLALSGVPASRPQVAAAPDGAAVVVWHAAPPDSEGEGIRYGPLFGTTVSTSAAPARMISAAPVHEADVAVSRGGEVLVTWSAPPNLETASAQARSLHFAVRPPGGAIGAEQVVPGLEAGAPSYAPGPRLVIGTAGLAVQAFGGDAIRATLRRPGGTFGRPELISPSGDFPILAATGRHLVAVFMAGSGRRLELSVRR